MTEELIQKLTEQLTLDEKIAMIHGNGLFQTGGVDRFQILFPIVRATVRSHVPGTVHL